MVVKSWECVVAARTCSLHKARPQRFLFLADDAWPYLITTMVASPPCCSGTVYRGLLHGATPCAIKVFDFEEDPTIPRYFIQVCSCAG